MHENVHESEGLLRLSILSFEMLTVDIHDMTRLPVTRGRYSATFFFYYLLANL